MLGFLPWEKWLPPYIYGPLISVGSICILVFFPDLSRWQTIGCWFCIIFGLVGTAMWLSTRRNIFDVAAPPARDQSQKNDGDDST
jgi:hypothetical protein